ncbi:hypothetical protein KC349_g364 [Hortaea werneckii]|nr:hypothetical protein KC349_g364 [Hortaea werneckii]
MDPKSMLAPLQITKNRSRSDLKYYYLPHEETKSPSAYYRGDQPDSYSELEEKELEEKDSRTSSESVRTVRYAPKAVESDQAPPARHGFSRKQSLASLTRKLSGLLGHGGSIKQEVNEEFGNDEPSRRKVSRKFSLPQFRGIGSLRKGSRAHEADEMCSKVSYLAPSLDRPDKRDRVELWSRSLSQDLLDFKGLDADKEVSTAPCSGFGEYAQLGHHYNHGQSSGFAPKIRIEYYRCQNSRTVRESHSDCRKRIVIVWQDKCTGVDSSSDI